MRNLYKFQMLLAFLLMITVAGAKAQVQTARQVSMIPNSKGYYEYLPQGYNTGSETYPLILFIHGMGELGNAGTSLSRAIANGPGKLINQGVFPTSFTVNGQTFRFIVLSPQFVTWPTVTDIDNIITYAIRNYRVNVNRIYLTGLSMGGALAWEYPGNNSTFANRIAATVPICGASWPDVGRSKIIATANLPVWATHNSGDGMGPASYTSDYVKHINSFNPTPRAKATIFQAAGHDAWTKTYDINFRENGMNIYEWMLQYQRNGTTPPPANLPPVARAGADVTITLPVNSVSLNGSSSSDPDGTISTYNWSKTAGPSSFTFSTTTTANPSVTNLVAGTYTFRLTVTDSKGATATDDINVTVNPAVTTPPPVTGGGTTGSQRVLIDFGLTATGTDQWGKYWNSVSNVQPGVRLTNAKTTTNTATTIGLEVINRIDGTFGTNGPGTNGGNTIGVVGDYPANATSDFAFAHQSTTSGKWRIYGLNAQKYYTIKFWGAKSSSIDYTIQIKRSDETVWREYSASNNTNANNAAVFSFSGKSDVSFDIRTKSGSNGFGYINVVDITSADAPTNIPPSTGTGDGTVEPQDPVSVLSIYPNPVGSTLILGVNNTYTGKLLIQIVDMKTGAIKQELNSNKAQTGAIQISIPLTNVPSGTYLARVWQGFKAEKAQFIKP